MSANSSPNQQGLEDRLTRFYAAEPSPAFVARLEQQLNAQAGRRPVARRAEGRARLGWLGGLAALGGLTLLLIFAMRLIPRQGGAVSSPTPSATSYQTEPVPTPTDTALVVAPPVQTAIAPAPTAAPGLPTPARRLLPGLCPPATPTPESAPRLGGLPQGFLGGGKASLGDFTLELRLACDPSFRADSPDFGRYTEFEGLGVYYQWRYDGPTQPGEIYEYSGFEPYVSQTNSSGPELSTASVSSGWLGVQFPSDVFPDFSSGEVALRYVLKLQPPSGGWWGAALNFRLHPQDGGYVPLDVAIEPLPTTEPVSGASTPTPFPLATRAPASVDPLLGEIAALNARWQEHLLAGAGWMHIVSRQENASAEGTLPNGQPIAAINIDDSWYQLDEQGRIVTWITRLLDGSGEPSQISIMKDGTWTNLTFSQTGRVIEALARPNLDSDFYRNAAWGVKMGAPLRKEAETYAAPGDAPIEAARYVIDLSSATNQGAQAGMRNEAVYDPQTGQVLVLRQYRSPGPGQALQLENQITTLSAERIDSPPSEILALLDQKVGPFQPIPPVGEPTPPGFDPAHSPLGMLIVSGDSITAPTFFYGDLYALYRPNASGGILNESPQAVGGYLLGRVDFGAAPGGWCDRSADGRRIAFNHETIANNTVSQASLRWLDLRDVSQVYQPAPELQPFGPPSFAPQASRLAFMARDAIDTPGLYILELPSGTTYRLAPNLISPIPPLWKPDGSQIAVQTMDENSQMIVTILKANNGEIVYQGPLPGSPYASWGVTFPESQNGFDNCIQPPGE